MLKYLLKGIVLFEEFHYCHLKKIFNSVVDPIKILL